MRLAVGLPRLLKRSRRTVAKQGRALPARTPSWRLPASSSVTTSQSTRYTTCLAVGGIVKLSDECMLLLCKFFDMHVYRCVPHPLAIACSLANLRDQTHQHECCGDNPLCQTAGRLSVRKVRPTSHHSISCKILSVLWACPKPVHFRNMKHVFRSWAPRSALLAASMVIISAFCMIQCQALALIACAHSALFPPRHNSLSKCVCLSAHDRTMEGLVEGLKIHLGQQKRSQGMCRSMP